VPAGAHDVNNVKVTVVNLQEDNDLQSRSCLYFI